MLLVGFSYGCCCCCCGLVFSSYKLGRIRVFSACSSSSSSCFRLPRLLRRHLLSRLHSCRWLSSSSSSSFLLPTELLLLREDSSSVVAPSSFRRSILLAFLGRKFLSSGRWHRAAGSAFGIRDDVARVSLDDGVSIYSACGVCVWCVGGGLGCGLLGVGGRGGWG